MTDYILTDANKFNSAESDDADGFIYFCIIKSKSSSIRYHLDGKCIILLYSIYDTKIFIHVLFFFYFLIYI